MIKSVQLSRYLSVFTVMWTVQPEATNRRDTEIQEINGELWKSFEEAE